MRKQAGFPVCAGGHTRFQALAGVAGLMTAKNSGDF